MRNCFLSCASYLSRFRKGTLEDRNEPNTHWIFCKIPFAASVAGVYTVGAQFMLKHGMTEREQGS